MTTTYTVTTSSELMENYIQSDILLPYDTFLALQTEEGTSLLFSIATGGVFELTMENPGSRYGWSQADLSTATISRDFPGGATCTNFGAAQAVGQQPGVPANINLAMVLNDGTNDHLYLSLGNSDSDLSWSANPVWTPCPFNASGITPPSPFLIGGVFISEATDGQYIVVDVINANLVSRYYIDVTNPASPTWMPHGLGVQIQATGYQSCLGRAYKQRVDGIYTMGMIDTSAQLIYVPLYNPFPGGAPPNEIPLSLPGGIAADAIAASRNADNTSDLYIAAQGGLYYYSSQAQLPAPGSSRPAPATQIVTSALLTGVRTLYAYNDGTTVTVWGLNGSDEVFYMTCAASQVGSPSAWVATIPVLTGVDAISPFIDRNYSANTFFAHAPDQLIKMAKTPATGLWTQTNITLPPSDTTQPPNVVSSYTTHIQVTDENGQPTPNVEVDLTATSVTSVFINHLYYIVGPVPITVTTDELGTVTIVQAVTTLAGARFNAVVAQQAATPVDPMTTAFQRNATYNTAASLQSAVITNRDGSTRPLVPPGQSGNLDAVAQSNQNLSSAYASVSGSALSFSPRSPAPRPVLALAGFDSAIATDFGDLFSWMESAVDAVFNQIVQDAEGLWHFVASIGGQLYNAVMDCVEAVVAAATWIYNQIEVAIEDVLQFLQFLFGWQDILTTHSVMKNVFTLMAQYAVAGLQTSPTVIAGLFQQLETDIQKWTNVPGFDQTPGSTSSSTPPPSGQNSAPSNLGVHHFQGNAANSSSTFAAGALSESIFQDLITFLQNEQDDFTNACSQIQSQIIEPFGTLGISDVIQRFVGILADTILESAENAINLALAAFAQAANGLLDSLTATIHIPVLSWLYQELTGDELSFLDLGCLIAAIPATIIYKIGAQAAPFPQNATLTNALLNATSFADVQAAFQTQSTRGTRRASGRHAVAAMPIADFDLDQDALKVMAFTTGLASFVGGTALIILGGITRLVQATGASPGVTILAGLTAIANLFYISPNITSLINPSDTYTQINEVVTYISAAKGFAFIAFADTSSKWIPYAFAFVETVINAIWNTPVIANIVEKGSAWNSTYKSIIPESIGNFAFNVGGMLELPIALAGDMGKSTMQGVQAGLMGYYGIFMVIASGIYAFAPGQSH